MHLPPALRPPRAKPLLYRSAPGPAAPTAAEAAAAEPRVRQIAEGIADYVEGEHNEAKSKPREEYRRPEALQHVLTTLLITQFRAPRGCAKRNDNAKEADRDLGEDSHRQKNSPR